MMHSCIETTSFRAVCVCVLMQSELLTQDKNLVVYLPLLSNTSQRDVPGIVSLPPPRFYSYLPKKCISRFHQNKHPKSSK